MVALHADGQRRRGLPNQFWSVARDKSGREGAKADVWCAGGRVQSAALERGIVGAGVGNREMLLGCSAYRDSRFTVWVALGMRSVFRDAFWLRRCGLAFGRVFRLQKCA